MTSTQTSGPTVEGRVCFLSATQDQRALDLVHQVLAILDELQVSTIGPAVTWDPGSHVKVPLETQPDIGIFIFSRELNPTLVFEIGTLVGARRPVLVIAPKELELPLVLGELPRLSTPIASEALRFQVDTFLRSKLGRRARPPSIGAETNVYRDRPRPRVRTPSAKAMPQSNALVWRGITSNSGLDQNLVRSLVDAPFKTAPLYPLISDDSRGSYADAALWVPEVEPLNPVILELKPHASIDAVDALASLLAAADLHVGIIAVPEELSGPTTTVRKQRAVVSVSISMLGDLSLSGILRRTLADVRNTLIHGSGD